MNDVDRRSWSLYAAAAMSYMSKGYTLAECLRVADTVLAAERSRFLEYETPDHILNGAIGFIEGSAECELTIETIRKELAALGIDEEPSGWEE